MSNKNATTTLTKALNTVLIGVDGKGASSERYVLRLYKIP